MIENPVWPRVREQFRNGPWLERAIFSSCALLLTFGLGMMSMFFHWAPAQFVDLAQEGWRGITERPAYYAEATQPRSSRRFVNVSPYPGLNLVTRLAADKRVAAEVRDASGAVLHTWDAEWSHVWPDAPHLRQEIVPHGKMETHIHGAVVLADGSLVFNYEFLGLVRIARDSTVMWRFPYQTHHSVHLHDDGTLWVCGLRERKAPEAAFPTQPLPTDEYTVLQLSQDGKLLREWSVPEMLVRAGYDGIFFMSSWSNDGRVRDDRVHMNDAEPFPSKMTPGFFTPGDVVVSLRNVNTVFVFNADTGDVKALWAGRFVRQHDPDFVDGNHLSVFDNNRRILDKGSPLASSRLVMLTAPQGDTHVYFSGTPGQRFYTDIMGKHQRFPNGNILITESVRGRAFEINAAGETVWEFENYLDEHTVAWLEEVQRLPVEYDALFQRTAP